MTQTLPRNAIFGLTIALCAHLAIVAAQSFAPMLFAGLGGNVILLVKVLAGLGVATTLGVVASLAQLVRRTDVVGTMAKVGIVGGVLAVVPWYAALPIWAYPAATVVGSVVPVACWLLLSAATHARGRAVPSLLTFVFALGVGLRIGAAIATMSLLSHGVVTLAFVGVFGTVGGLLVPAAQLALSFPLLPREA